MLPEAQHSPTGSHERGIDALIPLHRSANLGVPELTVGLRPLVVLGAAVPEAAVDEHSDPRSREDHVRTHCADPVERDPKVLAEAKTPAMQRGGARLYRSW